MDNIQKEKLSKLIIELMHDKLYVPMKLKELAIFLEIPKAERASLQEVLDELVSDGKIGISKSGKYGKKENFTHVGIYQANARGFGFVTIDGREDDIFIPADYTGDAMDGDKVRIIITKDDVINGKRAEGHVTQILEHANVDIVGFYRKNKTNGFVEPDNQKLLQDIYIPEGKDMHAMTGHKVVVHITKYAEGHHKPEGEIREILGHVNDPGVDILSIVRAYGLRKPSHGTS